MEFDDNDNFSNIFAEMEMATLIAMYFSLHISPVACSKVDKRYKISWKVFIIAVIMGEQQ